MKKLLIIFGSIIIGSLILVFLLNYLSGESPTHTIKYNLEELGYVEDKDNANVYTKVTTNNTRDVHYETIYNNESSKYNEFVFNRDALTFEEFISTFEVTTGKTETMHIVESLDTKVVSYNYEYSTYENSYLFEGEYDYSNGNISCNIQDTKDLDQNSIDNLCSTINGYMKNFLNERKKVISDEVLDRLIESTRQEPTIEQDSTSIE
ncbi:MAG: hypothetical protein IIZ67_05750 [Bacilli bacterium]|nr:hypothetical protein [Bacilli bacterium]